MQSREFTEWLKVTSLSTALLFLLTVAIALPINASEDLASKCLVRQGVLEIGSGSTKAFVAEVDTCQKKINKTLLSLQQQIAFNEVLERSPAGELPPEFIDESLPVLSSLIAEIRAVGAIKVEAFATSSFRVAKNGGAMAERIGAQLGIKTQIISQELEAELGAISALAALEIPLVQRSNIFVWDIGGGSMQIWGWNPQSERAEIFKGDLASVSFKNRVLREVLKKQFQKDESPNPLGSAHLAAKLLASAHAAENVPVFFKREAKKRRWVGVGGVHTLSVQKQVDASRKYFSAKELRHLLVKRAQLSDAEIPSEYRKTEITNLALVLGYMEALRITKVETASSSLGIGWLLRAEPAGL